MYTTRTSTSPDPLALLYFSRQLLSLHTACAKAAHLSFAGEYVGEFDRGADGLEVIATDGSSCAVLTPCSLGAMLCPVHVQEDETKDEG